MPKEQRALIREAALQGAAGRHWYRDAAREVQIMSRVSGLPPETVATVIAGTSPLIPVTRGYLGGGRATNIGRTRKVCRALAAGLPWQSALHPKTPGATLIERFVSLRSVSRSFALHLVFPRPDETKTHAFVRNLLGESDYVTIDSIMMRGLGMVGARALTGPAYFRIVCDVRWVAADLGWEPAEVQAACWTAWGGSGKLVLTTKRERNLMRRIETQCDTLSY